MICIVRSAVTKMLILLFALWFKFRFRLWFENLHALLYETLTQKQLEMSRQIYSLWPSDTIWWHESGSTLAQVMACCLTAPSHYLSQCWLIISLSPVAFTQGHHQKKIWRNLTVKQDGKCIFKISSRDQWVNTLRPRDNYVNPVCCIAIVCHQVRCMYWGHLGHFHSSPVTRRGILAEPGKLR